MSEWEPSDEAKRDALIEAAKKWFEMQSCHNTARLYEACAAFFGSNFDPTEYDDVP
jgi:hypothetical protein